MYWRRGKASAAQSPPGISRILRKVPALAVSQQSSLRALLRTISLAEPNVLAIWSRQISRSVFQSPAVKATCSPIELWRTIGRRRSRVSAFVPRTKRARSWGAFSSAQCPPTSTARISTPSSTSRLRRAGKCCKRNSRLSVSRNLSRCIITAEEDLTRPANSASASSTGTRAPTAHTVSPRSCTFSAASISFVDRVSYRWRHRRSTASTTSPFDLLSPSTTECRNTMSL